MTNEETQEEVVPAQDANEQAEAPAEEAEVDEAEVTPETEPEKKEPLKREVFSMPVAKAQDEKRKAVEKARKEVETAAEARIEAMRKDYEDKLRTAAPSDTDSKLREVAEKHGLNADAARELADAIRSGIKVPDVSKYEQLFKEREIEGHKSAVSREFDEKVQPLILKDHPNATPDFLREVKAKVEELAFTEGYNTYKLEDLYKVKRDEFVFKNGLSAEAPKGHGTDIQAFKKLSHEEEIKLADTDLQAYERYTKWLRGQESKYMD